ncbi:hypothetical protein [Marispirochaeta sp.]|jgi:hypothetical protein|uniref:hypothetical protein n=1 Tax=Marispirochaeta sp. TaxID=2038653 RepID=UPI0029C64C6E|nr:hypothetical protein [Marispirochaeta sp.]
MDADRFYRRMLKTVKENADTEERLDRIRDAFVDALPLLPGEMGIDLFWEVSEFLNLREQTGRDDFLQSAVILTQVVELFREEFGATEGEFPDGLWEIVRDCVNDYALELDEDLLNYLMGLVLDHGKI